MQIIAHPVHIGAPQTRTYASHTYLVNFVAQLRAEIGSIKDRLAVVDDVAPVRFPIWLVTHRELRTSRRIRVVFEALAQGLAVSSA